MSRMIPCSQKVCNPSQRSAVTKGEAKEIYLQFIPSDYDFLNAIRVSNEVQHLGDKVGLKKEGSWEQIFRASIECLSRKMFLEVRKTRENVSKYQYDARVENNGTKNRWQTGRTWNKISLSLKDTILNTCNTKRGSQ